MKLSKVKVNKKMFTVKAKPKSVTQVFDTQAEEEIKQLVLRHYNSNHRAVTPLAILLNFHLGLRVGELVALKWSDIEGNYLYASHMEIAKCEISENGDIKKETPKLLINKKFWSIMASKQLVGESNPCFRRERATS